MDNKRILVIEGGDVRLPNQPRGYHLWIRENGKKDLEKICLSVVPSGERFAMDMHETKYYFGEGPYEYVPTRIAPKTIESSENQESLLVRALERMYNLAIYMNKKTGLPIEFKLNDKEIEKKAFERSPFCAYAPGKQEWKERGNYYTAEELKQLDLDMDKYMREGKLTFGPIEEEVLDGN